MKLFSFAVKRWLALLATVIVGVVVCLILLATAGWKTAIIALACFVVIYAVQIVLIVMKVVGEGKKLLEGKSDLFDGDFMSGRPFGAPFSGGPLQPRDRSNENQFGYPFGHGPDMHKSPASSDGSMQQPAQGPFGNPHGM